jgi:Holliday junction DNA helicase RuvB
MAEEKLSSAYRIREDMEFEVPLRPKAFSEFIGQDKLKDNLTVFIEAAKQRKESLDHVLFYGPPGLGKTTLAHIMANEMEAGIKSTSGPAIEKTGELAAILTNLEPGDVLFIDEVHRLGAALEEILYPAMEEYKLDIIIGQGPGARSVKIDLPRFTLIGSSTRIGLLTSPLRDRFGILQHLDFYSVEDLTTIVKRSSRILDVAIDPDAAVEIARRSRGTPRIANRLLKRVRDFAQVSGDEKVSIKGAQGALEKLDVDSYGLDEIDRKILLTILEKFGGGPVGLNTLSAAIGEEKDTIQEIYEPYLIQVGFLDRTPRGRKATRRASEHLGVSSRGKGKDQKELF